MQLLSIIFLLFMGYVVYSFILELAAAEREQNQLDDWHEVQHRKIKASGEFDEY